MALSTAKKRNELSLAKKYELVKVAEKNPKLGARKLGEYFSCGKTQVCSILKNKNTIIELYESNASSVMQRSHCVALFTIHGAIPRVYVNTPPI